MTRPTNTVQVGWLVWSAVIARGSRDVTPLQYRSRMTTRESRWHRTGERCKRGQPIEQQISKFYVEQRDEPYNVKIETRCCRACSDEGEGS
jgi:hypothetical protein